MTLSIEREATKELPPKLVNKIIDGRPQQVVKTPSAEEVPAREFILGKGVFDDLGLKILSRVVRFEQR